MEPLSWDGDDADGDLFSPPLSPEFDWSVLSTSQGTPAAIPAHTEVQNTPETIFAQLKERDELELCWGVTTPTCVENCIKNRKSTLWLVLNQCKGQNKTRVTFNRCGTDETPFTAHIAEAFGKCKGTLVVEVCLKGKDPDNRSHFIVCSKKTKPEKRGETKSPAMSGSHVKRTRSQENFIAVESRTTRSRVLEESTERLCVVLQECRDVLMRNEKLSALKVRELQEMLRRLEDGGDTLGDIAYWVRKLCDADDTIVPGDVVALVIVPGSSDGLRATLSPPKDVIVFGWTVVARAPQGPQPVVVGNPSSVSAEKGILVVYMGHARVRCEPSVKAGDQLHGGGKQVGCASLSSSLDEDSKFCRLGIALGDYDASDGMTVAMVWIMRDHDKSAQLAALDESVKELQVRVGKHITLQVTREEVDGLSSQFKVLETRVDHMDERLGKVENTLQVPSKYDLDLKFEHVVKAFAADFVKPHYDKMCLKLFCQPNVKLSIERAILDENSMASILHGFGSGTFAENLKQFNWMILQGEAGIGKTVQLQSLCYTYGHHSSQFRSSFTDRSLWLYVDLVELAVGKAIWSSLYSLLETILVHCFAVPSEQAPTLGKALEHCKEHIVYCFDSFNEVEDVDWVKALLVKRQVPWLHRCIIATRPECRAILVPPDVATADKLEGIAPISLSMTGFESKSVQNLMIHLTLGEANADLAVRVREWLDLHPRFSTFAGNPLLCQIVCMSLLAQQKQGGSSTHDGVVSALGSTSLFDLLDAMFNRLSIRAADRTQHNDMTLDECEKTMSEEARELLETLAACAVVSGVECLTLASNSLSVGLPDVDSRKWSKLLSTSRKEVRESGLLARDAHGPAVTFQFLHPLLGHYFASCFVVSSEERVDWLLKHIAPNEKLHDLVSFLLEQCAPTARVKVRNWLVKHAGAATDGSDAMMLFCLSVLHVEDDVDFVLSQLNIAELPHRRTLLLNAACSAGNSRVVKVLLKHPEFANSSNFKALAERACTQGHVAVLALLVEHYISAIILWDEDASEEQRKEVTARERDVQEMLLCSLRHARMDCVGHLIFHANADLEALLESHEMVIPDFMEILCQLPVVRYLEQETVIDLDADFIYMVRDSESQSAALLPYALCICAWDVVRYLINPSNDETVNKSRAKIAVHYAVAMDDHYLLKFLCEKCRVSDDFVEHSREEFYATNSDENDEEITESE